jgi:hypothetical protein
MVNIYIFNFHIKNKTIIFDILGGYSLEPVGSFRWTLSAIATFRFYHHFVLQPVSLVCLLKDRFSPLIFLYRSI